MDIARRSVYYYLEKYSSEAIMSVQYEHDRSLEQGHNFNCKQCKEEQSRGSNIFLGRLTTGVTVVVVLE